MTHIGRFDRNQPLRRTLVAVAALLTVLSAVPLAARGMTPEMVVEISQVTQAAVAPGGGSVAYLLRVPRSDGEAHGSSYSEVWVRSMDGTGEPVSYLRRPHSASTLAWSPDGRWLTFRATLKEHSPHTQVYAIPVSGGTYQRLTDHPSAVSDYAWSPDGNHILYIAREARGDSAEAARKSGRDWDDTAETVRQYRPWLLNVSDGSSRPLTDHPGSVWEMAWSPDGKTVLLQMTKTPETDDSYMFKRIYRVSVADGAATLLCETAGKLGPMAFSPDGKTVAWLGAVDISDPLAQSLFVVPATGGTPRNLTPEMEASAAGLAWIDNGHIALLANRGTATVISRVAVKDGKRNDRIAGTPVVNSMSLDRRSGALAVVANAAEHPRELYVGAIGGSSLIRRTVSNPALADVELGRQEVVTWTGPDGWTIEGVLTYPVGYQEGRRYPLALQIHGGPEGVSQNGWTTSAGYPVQVLAANGYAVLEPNYRGSGGRGVAFSKGDHDDLGGKEFEDVLAGIDALVERGLVDNDRVVTGGWSYGGYFSAWAATRHSERFRASVVAAGLTNWISFSGTTDIPHEMALVHWNSYWYDQPQLHWERSPIAHLDRARTPTMLVHGLKDDRVHPEQSIQMHQALKMKDIPTRMVLYPREPHGLRERAHELHFMNAVLEWFETHLQKTEATDRVLN